MTDVHDSAPWDSCCERTDPHGHGDVLRQQWIAQPEDTIGGWCVTLAIAKTPAQGNPPIADFCTQAVAEHVARLHNAHLGRFGLEAK